MHPTTRSCLLLLLLALLAGCPKLNLGTVSVVPGSASPTGFTVQVAVQIEETDETEGEDQQRASGKGLLGLHLPAGWTVTAARMQSPQEDTARALFAAPQAAGAFAESFPRTGGVWWAFSSATQTVPQGIWDYTLELDVVVPKKTKAGSLGLAVTVLSDDLKDLPAPAGFDVSIRGREVTLAARGLSLSGPEPDPESDTSKAPTGF